MEYLLMVTPRNSLLWVPLTTSNQQLLDSEKQRAHPDFRLTVDSPDELQTKGKAFLDRLLFSRNNHLN